MAVPSLSRHAALLASLLAPLVIAGCASAPAAKPVVAPAVKPPPVSPPSQGDADDADGLKVEGTLGTLEEEAIQAGLASRLEAISTCFQKQTKHEPYLDGKVSLHFRVARDGGVVRMRLSESTLGSISVERCILRAAAGVRFRAPRGGEAEFSYPLIFQGRMKPIEWNSGTVKDELLGAVTKLLDDGKGGVLSAPAGLALTFYIDGKGRAVSVGMIADESIEDAFADRFVTNLKKLKFLAPSGSFAKVSYTW